MSRGRFLVVLREATNNEQILALKSFLKESIFFWKESIRADCSKDLGLLHFDQNLENISSDIESACLDKNSTKLLPLYRDILQKRWSRRPTFRL